VIELQDPLTGLARPSILQERLEWLKNRREHDQRPFGLVQADISGFRQVNRQYGVSVGDSILVVAAARMRASVRPADLAGRLGNDDFQFVFSDGIHEVSDLESCVERLAGSINAGYEVAGLPIDISFDVAALFVGVPHPSVEEICYRADLSLVKAKHESRIVCEKF